MTIPGPAVIPRPADAPTTVPGPADNSMGANGITDNDDVSRALRRAAGEALPLLTLSAGGHDVQGTERHERNFIHLFSHVGFIEETSLDT
jgi:hypothetical protein